MLKILGKGSWLLTEASLIIVEVEVDKKSASAWLPLGLCLAKPYRAVFFVADYPRSSFGSMYREAALFLPVRVAGIKKALFNVWMLVDDDTALIIGRDFLGCPKKIGIMNLSVENDKIYANVDRKGHRLITIEGQKGLHENSPKPFFGQCFATVFGSVSICGLGMQFVTLMHGTEEILDSYDANVRIEISGTERDPLHTLKPGRVLSARMLHVNFGKPRNLPIHVLPVGPRFFIRHMNTRYI